MRRSINKCLAHFTQTGKHMSDHTKKILVAGQIRNSATGTIKGLELKFVSI